MPQKVYSAGANYLLCHLCLAHIFDMLIPYNCNPIPAFSCLGDKQLAAWAGKYNRSCYKPVP